MIWETPNLSRIVSGTPIPRKKIHTGSSPSATLRCDIKLVGPVLRPGMSIFTRNLSLSYFLTSRIAEEAREGKTIEGNEIYQMILSSPVKYLVMDNFTRSITINTPSASAFLNGDTATSSTASASIIVGGAFLLIG